MRITTADCYTLKVPDRPWAWSDEVFGTPDHRMRTSTIVVLRTDAGLDGLGEAPEGADPERVERETARWVGRDVTKVNLAALDADPALRGAFECAVLDLRGQALGVPIHELLGGKVRERVPVTLCTGYKTPQNTARDAAWGWEQGFRVYKMKCPMPVEQPDYREYIDYVEERVVAIGEVCPQMAVRPDLRRRLRDVWVAIELAKRLEGRPIDCFESPLSQARWENWRLLRHHIPFPVAEHAGVERLVELVRLEAIDYAIGGGDSATDTVRLATVADALGVPTWTQSVGLGVTNAFMLHAAAAAPGMTQASDFVGFVAKIPNAVREPFELEDGHLKVPDRPGLGFTLDREAVERFGVH